VKRQMPTVIGTSTPAIHERSGRATDREWLEGPHSRRKELWLVLRTMHDFTKGRNRHHGRTVRSSHADPDEKVEHPLVELLDRMPAEGSIAAEDLQLLLVTDDLDEADAHVRRYAIEQFGLRRRREPRPSWWLGERAGEWRLPS
jgi:hypothetical protein